MTSAELQSTLPQAPQSESSQVQPSSQDDSRQRPETPERHHGSPRLSSPVAEPDDEANGEEASSSTLMLQAEHSEEMEVTAEVGDEEPTEYDFFAEDGQAVDLPAVEAITSKFQ